MAKPLPWLGQRPDEAVAAQQAAGVGNAEYDPQQVINEANRYTNEIDALSYADLQRQLGSAEAQAQNTAALDLSPLAAMAEYYTGKKIGYKRPGMDEADRAKLLQGLESQIQKTQSGISDNERQMIQSVLQQKLYGQKAQAGEDKSAAAAAAAKAEKDAEHETQVLKDLDKKEDYIKLKGNVGFSQALDQMEDAVDQIDWNSSESVISEKLGNVRAAYANVLESYKDKAGLGAITSSDLELVGKAVNDPSEFKNYINRYGGIDGWKRQMDQLRLNAARRVVTLERQLASNSSERDGKIIRKSLDENAALFGSTRAGKKTPVGAKSDGGTLKKIKPGYDFIKETWGPADAE